MKTQNQLVHDFLQGNDLDLQSEMVVKVRTKLYRDVPVTLKDVLEDLATFSCKYYFIIKNELEAAARRAKGEIVGNAFSHSLPSCLGRQFLPAVHPSDAERTASNFGM